MTASLWSLCASLNVYEYVLPRHFLHVSHSRQFIDSHERKNRASGLCFCKYTTFALHTNTIFLDAARQMHFEGVPIDFPRTMRALHATLMRMLYRSRGEFVAWAIADLEVTRTQSVKHY